MPHFRRQRAVTNKAGGKAFDPVTAADRAAERAIRKAVLERFPDHGLVGEEYGVTEGAGRYRWLIDPIDGTRAFITGSPLWGTLVGLMEGPQAVFGLMNQPFTGERFWSDGRRAHWRGALRRGATHQNACVREPGGCDPHLHPPRPVRLVGGGRPLRRRALARAHDALRR